MSESERKCSHCQKAAARLLVRSDLGGQDDRVLVCGEKACQPPEGEWHSMALDSEGLAKEYEETEET